MDVATPSNPVRREGTHPMRLPSHLLPTERLAVSIPDATAVSGLSRSEIYRRLASGDIRAVKSGARTLILMDSLRAHVGSLPPAEFRTRNAA